MRVTRSREGCAARASDVGCCQVSSSHSWSAGHRSYRPPGMFQVSRGPAGCRAAHEGLGQGPPSPQSLSGASIWILPLGGCPWLPPRGRVAPPPQLPKPALHHAPPRPAPGGAAPGGCTRRACAARPVQRWCGPAASGTARRERLHGECMAGAFWRCSTACADRGCSCPPPPPPPHAVCDPTKLPQPTEPGADITTALKNIIKSANEVAA